MLLSTDQEKSVYLSGTREGAIHTDFWNLHCLKKSL